MKKESVIKRLEFAINAMNLANQWALSGKNYLIGSVDISGVENAIKFISEKKVKIACSAVWYNDGLEYKNQPDNVSTGFVVCGRRHKNCFTTLDIMGKKHDNGIVKREHVGFITSDNRYVTRKEAFVIANEANQLLRPDLYNWEEEDSLILTSECIFEMIDSDN